MFDHTGFVKDIIRILDGLLWLYFWILTARVIISWVNPDPYNRIVQVLCALTDPALNGLRRFMPQALWSTGLDFSPLILMLLIQVLSSILRNLSP